MNSNKVRSLSAVKETKPKLKKSNTTTKVKKPKKTIPVASSRQSKSKEKNQNSNTTLNTNINTIQTNRKNNKSANDFHTNSTLNYPIDIKVNKNIDMINRLINGSHEVLAQQEGLIDKINEISGKVAASDYEIDRLLNKNENDEFNTFLDKYSGNLNQVLNRLKSHSEEVDSIKCNI